MTTRELIDAIASGESVKIEDSFNNIMVDKVSERLDVMRNDLSQNMFRSAEEVAEVEEVAVAEVEENE